MSLTREESALMERRDELTDMERDVVDATFKTLFEQAKWRNVKVAGDDRSARFEASLIRLIFDSRVKE